MHACLRGVIGTCVLPPSLEPDTSVHQVQMNNYKGHETHPSLLYSGHCLVRE